MNPVKPLTQNETIQLLILLRKLWKPENQADQYIAEIAKSLFSLITKKIYEDPAESLKR